MSDKAGSRFSSTSTTTNKRNLHLCMLRAHFSERELIGSTIVYIQEI